MNATESTSCFLALVDEEPVSCRCKLGTEIAMITSFRVLEFRYAIVMLNYNNVTSDWFVDDSD